MVTAFFQSRDRLRGLFVLLMLALLWSGCAKQATPTEAANNGGYVGALDTTYEGALDAASQLALGTLMLEESQDAIPEEQAAKLLPLWQVLSGNEIQGELERAAVLRQIESTMTASQISAIREMRLTQESIQAWMQASGMELGGNRGQGGNWSGGSGTGPGSRPGGGGNLGNMTEEERTQMREQFQNANPEELATRRAQFSGQGRQGGQTGMQVSGMPGGSGTSSLLTRAVVALLSRKTGVAIGPAMTRVQATATPTNTSIPQPTATATPEPTATLEPIVQPTVTSQPQTPEPTATLEPAVQATATQEVVSQATPVVPTRPPSAAAATLPALEQIENTDPGPPFTIAVSRNTATQDPLVEESRQIQITGWVRNDSEQTYAVSRIGATFYDADGFRGVFVPGIRDGKVVSGEWLWHGAIDADFDCLLLAPGEICPFSVEITVQNMSSFRLYAEAAPTERESAPVALSNVQTSQDLTDYVRIQGTATNTNAFAVKNVVVSGALIDASGQMTSVGSAIVPKEGIAPGESVTFDLRIRRDAFVDYQLYAQAERDWN